MPHTGSLQTTPLPQVLLALEAEERTGRLTITHGVPIAHVYLAGGQWMVGERVGAQVSLAQQLVESGLVQAQGLEFGLGIPLYQIAAIPDRQLAQILTQNGFISSDQLRAWLTQDAAEMLATMLQWQDGEFTFEDGIAFPSQRVALPIQTSALLAGVSPMPGVLSGIAVPADLDVVLDFAEVSTIGDGTIEVTRDQWRLLSLVDGQRPLWMLAQALQAPEPVIQQLAGQVIASNLAVEVRRLPQG